MSEIIHLTSPLNFDTWTERASSSGKLNSNPVGKTPMQRYEEARDGIKEYELKAGKKKLTDNQQRDLDYWKSNLKELELHKNDIVLSATAKTHLKEVYWSVRTGIKPSFFSKYTENGTLAEDDAIKLISELDDPDLFEMGSPVYEKCQLPRQYNNHFEGNCDIKKSPAIQDIKCCWDIFTFYPHIDELLLDKEGKNKWRWSQEEDAWVLPENNIENGDYECQGIVYMELYGESEFRLRYCLVDMPQVLLEQEYKKIKYQLGGIEDEVYYKAIEEFKSKHTFSHLPLQSRVCTFKIKRNVEAYLNLCKRVEAARIFLNWYAEEMFYFENPQLRPKNLLESKLINVILNNLDNQVEKEINEQFKPIEDQVQEEDRIREDIKEVVLEVLENAINDALISNNKETIKDIKTSAFPEVLDEIKPDEKETEHQNENKNESIVDEKLEETQDTFLTQIQNLATIEDAVEFYMENSDKIDDGKYEQIFYDKKEALSIKVEAPKIKREDKPKPPPQSNQTQKSTIPSQPEKVYTGFEVYSISNGLNQLKENLTFDQAKSFILEYIKSKFPVWNTYQLHRDNITTFYAANKEVIERDLAFKEVISNLSKEECKRLIDIRRKEIEAQVNPSKM